METLKFKTNIKCEGCITTVTPFLNQLKGIESWKADVQSPDKILTVQATGVSGSEVVLALKKAGYKAETI